MPHTRTDALSSALYCCRALQNVRWQEIPSCRCDVQIQLCTLIYNVFLAIILTFLMSPFGGCRTSMSQLSLCAVPRRPWCSGARTLSSVRPPWSTSCGCWRRLTASGRQLHTPVTWAEKSSLKQIKWLCETNTFFYSCSWYLDPDFLN